LDGELAVFGVDRWAAIVAAGAVLREQYRVSHCVLRISLGYACIVKTGPDLLSSKPDLYAA
jgi:hypothetical protein